MQANKFLNEDFIPRFNKNFSDEAREKKKAYLKCDKNLELIFCMKEKRKIGNGNTFSWNGQSYIVDEDRSYKYRVVDINTHYNNKTTFDIIGKK